jgi:hypothetical protein
MMILASFVITGAVLGVIALWRKLRGNPPQ